MASDYERAKADSLAAQEDALDAYWTAEDDRLDERGAIVNWLLELNPSEYGAVSTLAMMIDAGVHRRGK